MSSEYYNNNEDDLDATIQEGFLDDEMDIPLISAITLREEASDNNRIGCLIQNNHLHHSHNKNDENTRAKTKMSFAVILCFIFMITEFIGGYIAGSLAIMTDAAHLTSDCVSFLIGIASIWISKKPADDWMSFGYKRMEILGAVTSIIAIWFLTAFLTYLAIIRIISDDFEIEVNTMMITSAIGIAMNISMALILHDTCGSGLKHSHCHHHHHHRDNNNDNEVDLNSVITTQQQVQNIDADSEVPIFVATLNNVNKNHQNSNGKKSQSNRINNSNSRLSQNAIEKHKNLNVRAAIIHVIGDFIQSIGVFIASIIIKFEPNAKIADPICTILFSFLVILTTITIIKDSIHVLLDAVPKTISIKNVENDLKNLDGIKSVHQLNIWSVTINHNIMTAHLIIDENIDSGQILKLATNLAKNKYQITQTTFQIEKIRNDNN